MKNTFIEIVIIVDRVNRYYGTEVLVKQALGHISEQVRLASCVFHERLVNEFSVFAISLDSVGHSLRVADLVLVIARNQYKL